MAAFNARAERTSLIGHLMSFVDDRYRGTWRIPSGGIAGRSTDG
jgi:hypothetical protein